MKLFIKITLPILIMMILIGIGTAAYAAILTLPADLTIIEDRAFEGDVSLDYVIVGEKAKRIGSKAFANSGIQKVKLPDSLYEIADDAFEGIENLEVEANEGSYAYIWAIKNKYIQEPEIPADGTTQIIMPESIQAGADLSIQIFGAENTISHSLYLINNATNKAIYRDINKRNGSVQIGGYELEDATYTLKVYTITNSYQNLSPVNKTIVVSGIKPQGTEDIKLPEKIGTDGYNGKFDIYKKLAVNIALYNDAGTLIETPWDEVYEDDFFWLWPYHDTTKRMTISISGYIDGLWSEWSEAKSIEVINGSYSEDNQYIHDLLFPETIYAGRDLEISFECDESVTWYNAELRKDGENIYRRSGNPNEINTVIMPGYLLDTGEYLLHIDYYVDDINYNFNRNIYVTTNRPKANIQINANKTEIFSSEYVDLQIESNGAETAYFKIKTDYDTWHKVCSLDENGSGVLRTSFDNYGGPGSKIIINACVKMGETWSAWSDPFTINVIEPERLPDPIIMAPNSINAGEDLIISISNIDDVNEYWVSLEDYFTENNIWERYYSKYNGDFDDGRETRINGAFLENGTYQVKVSKRSELLGYSQAESEAIKVTGTRPNAPTVTMDKDEFRIQDTITFTIDTTDCEQVGMAHTTNVYDNSWSYMETRDTTGNTTTWSYKIGSNEEDREHAFVFAIKKDGRWSKTTVIRKTVLGLPELPSPVVKAAEHYRAGDELSITFEPVEGATIYESWLYRIIGNTEYFINGRHSETPVSITQQSYDVIPGTYRYIIQAESDEYKSSRTIYEFTVDPYEYDADVLQISIDRTEIYDGESANATITAEGVEAIICRKLDQNGDIYDTYFARVDEDGNVPDISLTGSANSNGTDRIWKYTFCAVVEGVCSAWTEPVSITVKYNHTTQPATIVLTNPVLHVPDAIEAGSDLVFSFDTVENATEYHVHVYYYYGTDTIYYNYTEMSNQDIYVSGAKLSPGTYQVLVDAYAPGADGMASSTAFFKVTGQRSAAPTVTTDKEEYVAGDPIIFTIDSTSVDEIDISYSISNYTSGSKTIKPTENSTEWVFNTYNYYQGRTCEFKISVKREGKWSKFKTIKIQLPEN